MDCFEAFLVDVGVDLGGRDVGVAEEFLNDAEIGTVLEEVGGEGVAKEVGVDVLVNAGLLSAIFDDLPDTIGGERSATDGEEDFGGGFFGD